MDDAVLHPHSPRSPRSLAAVAADAYDVPAMLDALKLSRYWTTMRDEGYDDLATLLELDDEELYEMCEACSLKRGHALKLRKAVQGLRKAVALAPSDTAGVADGELPIGTSDSGSLRRAMTFSSRPEDLRDALDSHSVKEYGGATSREAQTSSTLGAGGTSGNHERIGTTTLSSKTTPIMQSAARSAPVLHSATRGRAGRLMDGLGVQSLDTAVTVLKAVTRMQAMVRTKSARRMYGQMLFDKYREEEDEHREEEQRKLEEGMRLLERKDTERELHEAKLLARFKDFASEVKDARLDSDQ